MTQTLRDALRDFKRQALHAIRLGLIHPETQQPMEWQIELPADMKTLLEAMRVEDEASGEAFELDYGDGLQDSDDLENDAEELEDDEDVA